MRKRLNLLYGAAILMALAVSVGNAQAVLTIESAEVETGHPATGHQVKVNITVKNKGADPVPGMTSLGVRIYTSNANGVRVPGEFVMAIPYDANTPKNIRALEPNESQQIEATAVLNKVGMHTAQAEIINEDIPSGKLQFENRTLKTTFEVFQPADVALQSVKFNEQGRLVLVLYNAGAMIPNDQFNNSIISIKAGAKGSKIPLRNAVEPTFKLAAKGAMLGGPIRHTYVVPAGGAYGVALNPYEKNKVEVTLDYNGKIADSNRYNNIKKVDLGAKPDLVVCFRKYVHSKPGRYANYSPVIKNIGFAEAPASRMRFWIEGKGVHMLWTKRLKPREEYGGARLRRRVLWRAWKVDNHIKFRLTADFRKQVDESEENNNVFEGTISVGSYALKRPNPNLCSNEPGSTGFN